MPINVGEALDIDTAIVVTVERTATGNYTADSGNFTKGATSTFKTLASVQQPTPEELIALPEGERNKDIKKFITKKPVRTVQDKDGFPADRILFQGNFYKLIDNGDWSIYGQNTAFGARD